MAEGGGGLKDALFKVLGRGRAAPSVEVAPKSESLLGNGEFKRNPSVEAALKAVVINPEAVVRGIPAVPLVDRDESVVRFTGTPEQFVSFVTRAQAVPVGEVFRQPATRDNISNVDLRRTGVQIIRPFGSSKSANYLYPADPEGIPTRMEVVGATINSGQLELHLMYPPTITMRVPTMAESEKGAWAGEEGAVVDVRHLYERAGKEEISLAQLAVEHPFISNSNRWDALFGLDDGSVITQFRVHRGQGSRRRPGTYLRVEKRKPDPDQRIGSRESGGIGILRIPANDPARLRAVFQEIIVPDRAARNLRVPAVNPITAGK